MIYEKNNTTGSTKKDNKTFDNINDCEEKIENLNKKLQATADELEEISALYAKSVKDGLDKAKKIKKLEDIIAELEDQLKKCQQKGKATEELEKQLIECQDKKQKLENQLKDCQDKQQELENQLKKCQEEKKKLEDKIKELEKQLTECQDKSKKVDELEKQLIECQKTREELKKQLKEAQEKSKKAEENKEQWILGEYKWMAPGSTMPKGWVKIKITKGFTLVEGNEKGETTGIVGKHNHKFLGTHAWTSPISTLLSFINDRSAGPSGSKYVPFVTSYNDIWRTKTTDETGKGISNSDNNLAAGIFAELWQYVGIKMVENSDEKSEEKTSTN